MTKGRTYLLTGVAAGLFVLLCAVFADGMFDTGNLWNADAIASSTIWTYLLLAVIVAAGLFQARQLPDEGIALTPSTETGIGQVDDPRSWKLLIGNVYWSLLWLPLRFFIGLEWLAAGEHKVRDDAWMNGGSALQGYWQRAITVPEGRPSAPAGTYAWYEDFLRFMLNHEWYTWFAKVIAVGELLVGLGLLVGALVGIAAFFGTLMNFSFELAGSASTNPVLFGLGVFLVLGWKVAGYWGLDRVLLRMLGTPWQRGAVRRPEVTEPRETPTPTTPRGMTA
jgi:thiosulfate dehydrogenase [quinone] large subunit